MARDVESLGAASAGGESFEAFSMDCGRRMASMGTSLYK